MTRPWWQWLVEAESFLAIAKRICVEATAQFELTFCSVGLHEPDGRPVLVIDNLPARYDGIRLGWVDGTVWERDPLLQAVRGHRGPAGDEALDSTTMEVPFGDSGAVVHLLLLPLIEPGGILGSIRCGRPTPFSDVLRRDLVVLSTHVSVRLAQLGVSTIEGTVELSARQRDVAELAARGRSNFEIADVLAISENTVKKRLKEVFARLEISNRTELVRKLRRLAISNADAPVGITRDGALTITRGVPRRPAAARGS